MLHHADTVYNLLPAGLPKMQTASITGLIFYCSNESEIGNEKWHHRYMPNFTWIGKGV